VNDRPEEAARAEREEEHERKQPGEAELMRIHEGADKTEYQAHNGNPAEKRRKPCKSTAVEIFALGHRWRMQTLAHFAGVVVGGGEAGLSISAR